MSIANLGYKEVLDKFESYLDYLEEIEKIRDKIEWEKAKRINTQKAYEKYLLKYHNGIYSFEAKQRIDEFIAIKRARELERKRREEEKLAKIRAEEDTWRIVCKNNTEEDYENYLRYYPNGIYANEAKSIIRKLQEKDENTWRNIYNSIFNSNLYEKYKKYLNDFPNGKYRKEALEKIKDIEKERALYTQAKYKDDINLYKLYLNNYPYPEGEYSKEILSKKITPIILNWFDEIDFDGYTKKDFMEFHQYGRKIPWLFSLYNIDKKI